MSNKTMKAAVLHAVADFRYEDVPMPVRGEGEVMLKVGACGVCGSDIPRVFTKGTYHFPTIPGHEFAGKIVESDDPALLGRKAAIFPLIPCRKCAACEVGEYVNCENYDYYGSRRDGGFAEYVAIKKENLVLLPDNISYACGSMCEPGSVARAAIRRLDVCIGDKVVVFGAGPIGLIAAQWARVAGAQSVRVVDINEKKLEFAASLGFEAYDMARDGKVDCVLEGTGASAALNNAVLALKDHGRMVLMGNPARDMNIAQSTYSQILRREITMSGTWNSSFNRRCNDWAATVEAMASGLIKYEELITHRVPLSHAPEALEMMRDGREFYNKVTVVNQMDD